MKKAIRVAALVIVFGAIVYWLAMGANRGWTKNKIARKTTDAVTGLEGVTYENKFVPGVDFLGIMVLGGGVLIVISLLLPGKKDRNLNKPNQSL